MAPGDERTGVMVVRIWFEGTEGVIRARLTETLDITATEETSRAAAGVEEIVEIVREWVERFVNAGQ